MTPEEKERLATAIFNSVDFSLSGSAWSEVSRCIEEMPEEIEPPVATSRFEDRLLRLERIISLLIKGGKIHLQEEEGWGITREELDFIRNKYKEIREEHHFNDDYIQDDHQERKDLLHSDDHHQTGDRS